MPFLFIVAPGDLDLVERGDKWVAKSSAEGALGAGKSRGPGQQTPGRRYSRLLLKNGLHMRYHQLVHGCLFWGT